jgi:hypothetical protein
MKTLVSFDYKYSTVNFEKFLPKGNFGQYVGYDSGAIWRIGNPGNRNGRKRQSETSIPKFFTEFDNSLRENGVYHHLSLDHINQMVFQKLPKHYHLLLINIV